jgi:hypothetical protein
MRDNTDKKIEDLTELSKVIIGRILPQKSILSDMFGVFP